MTNIQIGDSVRTVNQMYFVEATNPETNDTIETRLPKWHRLAVCDINSQNNTINVQLPNGYVATLDSQDLEP